MKVLRVLLSVLLLTPLSLFAAPLKLEDWVDTQGQKFRGEPVELLGPLALFRTGHLTGRRIPVNFLKPEDCVRFQKGVSAKPPREDWTTTRSDMGLDSRKFGLRLVNSKLVPANINGKVEPQFWIIFFAHNGESQSWDMLGSSVQAVRELQQKYPDMIEGLQFGTRHSLADHTAMATSMNVPWLVASYYEQSSIEVAKKFAPRDGFAMLVVSRHIVPILSAQNPTKEEVAKMLVDLGGILELMRNDNPKGWGPRLHYWSSVQLAAHPTDRTGPMLIGNPLKAEGLVQRKIYQFDANLTVGADGAVTNVVMQPNESVSEKMSVALAEALKKAVFVPAVEKGTFVESEYGYHFEAPKP